MKNEYFLSDCLMKSQPIERPLTLLRAIRGAACLIVFISTALMFLVCFSPVAELARLISVSLSRKTASFIFSHWLGLWPFLFEKINGTKVVFAGDEIPRKERVLLIANHRTEVDWMYLWNLAHRKGTLGHIKYVFKSSLMKLPIFGWGFHILEFLSVRRKWEADEPSLRNNLSSFTNPNDPLWLALFPEGTDFTELKCAKSKIFAAEGNLPILSNVLLPKGKGFCLCLQILRDSIDAVYDVTIAYKYRCPTFMDNVFGVNPMEVHMHVRRIDAQDIPATETESAGWLLDAFVAKDKLLSDFRTKGRFPDGRKEESLSAVGCAMNCAMVVLVTSGLAYLTVLFIWFRVYVGVSCAYLATATYFGFHPLPLTVFLPFIFGSHLKK